MDMATSTFRCLVCGYPLGVEDLDGSCSGCDFPLAPVDFGLTVSKIARLHADRGGPLRRLVLAARQHGPLL
jgi:hypothetical protein